MRAKIAEILKKKAQVEHHAIAEEVIKANEKVETTAGTSAKQKASIDKAGKELADLKKRLADKMKELAGLKKKGAKTQGSLGTA